jgi:hypothetical protein
MWCRQVEKKILDQILSPSIYDSRATVPLMILLMWCRQVEKKILDQILSPSIYDSQIRKGNTRIFSQLLLFHALLNTLSGVK